MSINLVTYMTALCDHPNLLATDLCNMLSMALPSLTYTSSYQWFISDPFVWLQYFPNALPHHRWQLKQIYKTENYRYVRKDGSYGDRTKTYTVRFGSLVDAITYYETEIKQ